MTWVIHDPDKAVEAGGRLVEDELMYGLTVGDLMGAYETMRQELLDDPDAEPQLPPWAELSEEQQDAVIRAAGHSLAHLTENWPDILFFVIPDALAGEGDCASCGEPVFGGYQHVPEHGRYHPECWDKAGRPAGTGKGVGS
jgi:hypothetical protein